MNIVNQVQKNSPIGFFDSGVGGLSVYARFKELLPDENTLYFGDLKNLPYGNKSQEQLIGYARKILDFYKRKCVKAVVIACNTSSAQAYDSVKDEYDFKIFPIIQTTAKIIAQYNRVGIFATKATVSSKAYTNNLIKYNSKISTLEIASTDWVGFVESDNIYSDNAINDIKAKMEEMLLFEPEKIVLGCTHYPYLLPVLKNYAREELFVDPANLFVKEIKKYLEMQDLLATSGNIASEKFFVSSSPEEFKKNAKFFYDVSAVEVVEV